MEELKKDLIAMKLKGNGVQLVELNVFEFKRERLSRADDEMGLTAGINVWGKRKRLEKFGVGYFSGMHRKTVEERYAYVASYIYLYGYYILGEL